MMLNEEEVKWIFDRDFAMSPEQKTFAAQFQQEVDDQKHYFMSHVETTHKELSGKYRANNQINSGANEGLTRSQCSKSKHMRGFALHLPEAGNLALTYRPAAYFAPHFRVSP
jgi:hypothetical protein